MENLTQEEDVVICKTERVVLYLRLKDVSDGLRLIDSVSASVQLATAVQAEKDEYPSYSKSTIVQAKETIHKHGKISYASPQSMISQTFSESVFTTQIHYSSSLTFEDRQPLSSANNEIETDTLLTNESMPPVFDTNISKESDSSTNLDHTKDAVLVDVANNHLGEVAQDNVQCSDIPYHSVPEPPPVRHSTPVSNQPMKRSRPGSIESKTPQVWTIIMHIITLCTVCMYNTVCAVCLTISEVYLLYEKF